MNKWVGFVFRFSLMYLWVTGILIGILFFSTSTDPEGDLMGKVEEVLEGDRFVLSGPEGERRILLVGIDSPEKDQPYFEESKEKTGELSMGRKVIVRIVETHADGVSLAEVTLPDRKILNRELVKAGLAWWDRIYEEDRTLRRLEQRAKSKRLGLWIDPHPVPPWEHRKKLAEAIPTPTPEIVSKEVMEAVRSQTNRYVGDSTTKIYYWPGCPEYDNLDAVATVIFSSPYEAQSAGYRKAINCN